MTKMKDVRIFDDEELTIYYVDLYRCHFCDGRSATVVARVAELRIFNP